MKQLFVLLIALFAFLGYHFYQNVLAARAKVAFIKSSPDAKAELEKDMNQYVATEKGLPAIPKSDPAAKEELVNALHGTDEISDEANLKDFIKRKPDAAFVEIRHYLAEEKDISLVDGILICKCIFSIDGFSAEKRDALEGYLLAIQEPTTLSPMVIGALVRIAKESPELHADIEDFFRRLTRFPEFATSFAQQTQSKGNSP